MTRYRCCLVAVLVMLGWGACAFAATFSFESPDAGWQTVAGHVGWAEDQVAGPAFCLALSGTEDDGAWAVSPPVGEVVRGRPVDIIVRLRREVGPARFALSLVDGGRVPAAPLLYEGVVADDAAWHELRLTVMTGLAAPCVAVGVVGGSGRWLVDEIALAPSSVPSATEPVPEALRPVYAPTLPVGWQPEGDMDSEVRRVGGESRFLRVGPLELRPSREIAVRRGDRGSLELDVFSRSPGPTALTLEISGPPGICSEITTLEVPARQMVVVRLPVQPLWAGSHSLLLKASTDGDSKQMPLQVEASRYWPTLGATWPVGADPGAYPDAIADGGVQFHHVTAPAGAEQAVLAGLAAAGADVGVTWEGGQEAAIRALGALPEALAPQVSVLGLRAESTDDCGLFVDAVKADRSDAVLLSIPFDLHTTPSGLRGDERLDRELAGTQVARADALHVRLPEPPASVVVRQLVDEIPSEGPLSCWEALEAAWSLEALRQQLWDSDAALPLFAELRSGGGTGDAALDALIASRAVLQVFLAGANAVTAPAVALEGGSPCLWDARGEGTPLLQAFSELTRELASARLAATVPGTDIAACEPGKPITFRPFIRGNEGVLFLRNNTQRRQRLAVEVRRQPASQRLLRLSYPGETVQREYSPSFAWSELALHYRRPAIYIDMDPLQVAVLSLHFYSSSGTWLREVGPRPADPEKPHPMDMDEFEKLFDKEM